MIYNYWKSKVSSGNNLGFNDKLSDKSVMYNENNNWFFKKNLATALVH